MSGTWNQLPCFFLFLGFLQVGHRHQLAEVVRMWFAGCQRLGSVEMAKFQEILTPEKGGTCLNCPSVWRSSQYSILYWAEFFVGLECVETRKRKTNCQVKGSACSRIRWLLEVWWVVYLSHHGFLKCLVFFWGMDTAQWNYEVMSNQVKNRMPCRVCYSIFFIFFQVIILPCWYEMYLRSIP